MNVSGVRMKAIIAQKSAGYTKSIKRDWQEWKRTKNRKDKVTAVNEKGTHKYHCISQDGKGVYGWVNAESIKELSSKAHSDPASVSKGDIVTFTGGGVYKSSTAEYASVQKNVTSTCKVTAVNTKGTHPYHCISQDGKGVYGWVNAADVK